MPATLTVGGVLRTYLVHVPANLLGRVPLVLAFHGHFGTAARMVRITRFDALADADGFVVAYPDGLGGSWNDGRPQTAGADDVGFVRALVAELSRTYPIDPKRVYATGFSNGGIFTQYLGCRAGDLFAAIAPVSGYLPVAALDACRPARSPSVLEIGGDADPIVPYDGGTVAVGPVDRGSILSAARSVAFWARAASCAEPPAVAAGATTYASCGRGRSVVLETVAGGGHAWPGGTASTTIDASRDIARFFLAHPMP